MHACSLAAARWEAWRVARGHVGLLRRRSDVAVRAVHRLRWRPCVLRFGRGERRLRVRPAALCVHRGGGAAWPRPKRSASGRRAGRTRGAGHWDRRKRRRGGNDEGGATQHDKPARRTRQGARGAENVGTASARRADDSHPFAEFALVSRTRAPVRVYINDVTSKL